MIEIPTLTADAARSQYLVPLPYTLPDHMDAEQWTRGTFSHRGRTIAYWLYLPKRTEDAPECPLVVMLHGCGQDAGDFAAGTQMHVHSGGAGVAVLYPEQAQWDNAYRCWNWYKPQHQARDGGEPALLAALALSVAREHRVDRSRMFVAGLSAGGAMADILGRGYPDIFAAVGVHSGLRAGAARDAMSALSVMRSGSPGAGGAAGRGCAVPTIVFHGDGDTTVHPGNGCAVVDAAVKAHESETLQALFPQATAGVSVRGRRFTRTVYQDGMGRCGAELWELHGTGHAWSGGDGQGSFTDTDGVDASAEMLRFFLAHPMPAVA